ncbi:MAG: D-alanyl-D-alanine carboxypeptidase family protein [Candidatus Curtissbacteria bacterium]|nr:D-alanyl-D-alanine carboxypeptidase family protein [Candidatus Curtissbacteria bacterium]
MKLPQAAVAALILAISISFFILPKYRQDFPFTGRVQKIDFQDSLKLEPYPITVSGFESAPTLSAQAATVIDNKTGVTLFEKDPDLKHLPASTTKLMTALVALENCLPQTVVRIGFVEEKGTKMGLAAGDQLTVESLLYGLLVPSGNDAAFVLAYSCNDSYLGFIAEMNKKAKDLGMVNTHFVNPAGFDDQFQYSTARDLTKLSRAAVANPLISKIVATKSIVVNDVTGTKTYYLENVNKLLGKVPGVEGVKTGQTEGSLENLVARATRGGNTIITVVLGSGDRFGETGQLIEWAYKNHKWISPGQPKP